MVASSLDLLGTKLKVIMQRAESKDYYRSTVARRLESDRGAEGAVVIARFRLLTGGVPSRLDVLR